MNELIPLHYRTTLIIIRREIALLFFCGMAISLFFAFCTSALLPLPFISRFGFMATGITFINALAYFIKVYRYKTR